MDFFALIVASGKKKVKRGRGFVQKSETLLSFPGKYGTMTSIKAARKGGDAMGAREKLFGWKDPYDTEGTEEVFTAAMRENAAYSYAHCPEYRAVLDDQGFSPEDLRTPEDLARLPFLPTAFLKAHHLFAMPRSRMLIRASSSGTSGAGRSEIGLELGALAAGARMVAKVASPRRILSPVPCHYVIFGYPPRGTSAAAAKTAFGYTFLAPALSRTYAMRKTEGGYVPDLNGAVRALVRLGKSPFPTRLMGFPSYTYFALKLMEERGLSVRLPAGSSVMLGGGWKQHWREKPEKGELYALIRRTLGIPEEAVMESYGAAEHPILYCDCPAHRFHVPVYSRVIIRDPWTLEPLPMGKTGLVNLLTPMIFATPVLSVLTDDLGILHPGGDCYCGKKSPWLEIIGRAGMEEIRTCAAGAEALLAGMREEGVGT